MELAEEDNRSAFIVKSNRLILNIIFFKFSSNTYANIFSLIQQSKERVDSYMLQLKMVCTITFSIEIFLTSRCENPTVFVLLCWIFIQVCYSKLFLLYKYHAAEESDLVFNIAIRIQLEDFPKWISDLNFYFVSNYFVCKNMLRNISYQIIIISSCTAVICIKN